MPVLAFRCRSSVPEMPKVPGLQGLFAVPLQVPDRIRRNMTNQNEPELSREIKRRFQLWLKPSVLRLSEEWYPKDNCGCRSEFIEKAILFYAGYLASEGSQNYIAKNITSTLRGMMS